MDDAQEMLGPNPARVSAKLPMSVRVGFVHGR
jgi:hypothetical protein